MTERNRGCVSRRRALACAGSGLAVALAGCTGGDDSGGTDTGTGNGKQPLERDDWADVDEIRLEGYTRGWYGVEPEPIADVRNPAILLVAGNEYEITWENRDGGTHNIAIRDRERNAVGGHRTRTMHDRNRTQSLSFTATDAMHEYVCEPHPSSMIGYFKVVD